MRRRKKKREESFEDFSTTCPYCKKDWQLFVVHLTATTRMPLKADGFAVTDSDCFDTEDELVHCEACDKVFPLSEATL